jgi:hypothetical protein
VRVCEYIRVHYTDKLTCIHTRKLKATFVTYRLVSEFSVTSQVNVQCNIEEYCVYALNYRNEFQKPWSKAYQAIPAQREDTTHKHRWYTRIRTCCIAIQ